MKRLQKYQRSKLEVDKELPTWPDSRPRSRLTRADFLSTSNFDLWYFCGPLTKSNVQYLIWKIYFISVWSQKPKVIAANLDYENLSQKTLISYHKWAFVLEWLSFAISTYFTYKYGSRCMRIEWEGKIEMWVVQPSSNYPWTGQMSVSVMVKHERM